MGKTAIQNEGHKSSYSRMRHKDDIDCVIKLQQDKTYRWDTDFRVINEFINGDKM